MKRVVTSVVVLFVAAAALAQQPQIPTLQVCNGTTVSGLATVQITERQDISHTGKFDIRINISCDPVGGNGFPSGALTMHFSLSDSSITDFNATTVEQMTTTGKHTPTTYLNGRCMANANTVPCHYWLLIANNRPAGAAAGTPDIVSVLVVDKQGKRLTYGTGPVGSGDVNVGATAF